MPAFPGCEYRPFDCLFASQILTPGSVQCRAEFEITAHASVSSKSNLRKASFNEARSDRAGDSADNASESSGGMLFNHHFVGHAPRARQLKK